MKKYKLIKKYPGSPKVDTIVIYSTNECYEDSYCNEYSINYIENYPEFWEKVVEKDYEILSFYYKNIAGKGDTYVDPNYVWFETYKGSGKWSRAGHITHPHDTDEILRHFSIGIHSVKRLSDGEIFTIGDKCNLNNGNGYRNPIIKIELTKNNNTGLEKYRNRETIKITLETMHKTLWGPFELDAIVKSKQPLFRTEDGVDIYEGDTFWFVPKNFVGGQAGQLIAAKNAIALLAEARLSTKEKAEEYILLNKPYLSINDIIAYSNLSINQLKEKVKSKL